MKIHHRNKKYEQLIQDEKKLKRKYGEKTLEKFSDQLVN